MKKKQILLITGAIVLLAIVAPIVFFYITMQASKPKVLNLKVPKASIEYSINRDSSLEIFVLKDNKYLLKNKRFITHELELKDAKEVILENKEQPVVIIETNGASYKSIVDILDEMQVCRIKKYELTEMSKEDSIFLDTRR